MRALASLYLAVFQRIEHVGNWLLPLVARFIVAASLLAYYWHSGLTKLGDGALGIFTPSIGAYAQIFPRQIEAVGYDVTQLSLVHWWIVVGGTWAEFLLPTLVVAGLMTRLASLGLIGFIILQSLTDVYGHGMVDAKTLGFWFDRFPDSVIMDQRLFWVFTLAFLVVRGGGALSLDAALRHWVR